MKKMREYEARVLTALGFKPDDPVVLRECSPDDFLVTFKWYAPKDSLPAELVNAYIHRLEAGEVAEYRVMVTDLPGSVWLEIVEARREWDSNFPRVNHA